MREALLVRQFLRGGDARPEPRRGVAQGIRHSQRPEDQFPLQRCQGFAARARGGFAREEQPQIAVAGARARLALQRRRQDGAEHGRVVGVRAVVRFPGRQPGGVGQQVFEGDPLAPGFVLGAGCQRKELGDEPADGIGDAHLAALNQLHENRGGAGNLGDRRQIVERLRRDRRAPGVIQAPKRRRPQNLVRRAHDDRAARKGALLDSALQYGCGRGKVRRAGRRAIQGAEEQAKETQHPPGSKPAANGGPGMVPRFPAGRGTAGPGREDGRFRSSAVHKALCARSLGGCPRKSQPHLSVPAEAGFWRPNPTACRPPPGAIPPVAPVWRACFPR